MVSKRSKRLITGTRLQIVPEETSPVQNEQEVKRTLKEEKKELQKDFIKQIIWDIIVFMVALLMLFLLFG